MCKIEDIKWMKSRETGSGDVCNQKPYHLSLTYFAHPHTSLAETWNYIIP